MRVIWSLRIYDRKSYFNRRDEADRFRAVVKGQYGEFDGVGGTPQAALREAIDKMEIRPWFIKEGQFFG